MDFWISSIVRFVGFFEIAGLFCVCISRFVGWNLHELLVFWLLCWSTVYGSNLGCSILFLDWAMSRSSPLLSYVPSNSFHSLSLVPFTSKSCLFHKSLQLLSPFSAALFSLNSFTHPSAFAVGTTKILTTSSTTSTFPPANTFSRGTFLPILISPPSFVST